MLKREDKTLPGWRDFERTVAVAFDGETKESKWIYDVVLGRLEAEIAYGVSCKMRSTLREVKRKGRVTIELSNASGQFWDSLIANGITQENYHNHAESVGKILIGVVEEWHTRVDFNNGGIIDNLKSLFLSLQWNGRDGNYQLFQFPINLPKSQKLNWEVRGRRLIGHDESGVLFEWFGLSGGQLKYYPLVHSAIWKSPVFSLEPLPDNLEFGLLHKAKRYFPTLWRKSLEK